MEELLFRTAREADTQRIMEIIAQAQAQMRALGSQQWQNGYPAVGHIAADIARGVGRVLCKRVVQEDGGPGPAALQAPDLLPVPALPAPASPESFGASSVASSAVSFPVRAAAPAFVPALPADTASFRVIAYGAAIFDGEPAYGAIEGRWLTDEPYLVVHRLAVADGEKRRGVAGRFLDECAALARLRGCRSFRIDTNFDNRYMLRLLARQGFVRCGVIRYEGGERIAFERAL